MALVCNCASPLLAVRVVQTASASGDPSTRPVCWTHSAPHQADRGPHTSVSSLSA